MHSLNILVTYHVATPEAVDATYHEESLKRAAEKIVDEFILKHRRIEGRRPERILSYTSNSYAFQMAESQNRIQRGIDFFFSLVMPIKSTAFRRKAPSSDADENTVHHKYFLNGRFPEKIIPELTTIILTAILI